MKKIGIIILAALLILSFVGCAGEKKTTDPDAATGDADTKVDSTTVDSTIADTGKDGADDAEPNEEPEQPYDNVPDTNVPIYPNSQLVYDDLGALVYATTDSGEAVNNFYQKHPDFKESKSSGKFQEGYYYHQTPLVSLARALMRDDSQEKKDEVNAYIKEFGGLQTLTIFDAEMDEEMKKLSLTNIIFSQVPHDKTLILYAIMEER